MALFDFFHKKNNPLPYSRGSYFHTAITDTDLHSLINQAINVFENNKGADAVTIIHGIYAVYNDKALAIALYRFIPTAFCRLFFTQVNYADEYYVRHGNDHERFYFSADGVFNMVAMISKQRIVQSTRPEETFSILFHSADFNAINKAVKDGADLHDVSSSPALYAEIP